MQHNDRAERWVIVTQYYPPETGAPQIRLHALAKQLQQHGVHVRVLTGMPNYPTGVVQTGYRGRWRYREQIDGVEVERVWLFPASGRNRLKRLCNYLSFSLTATLYLLFCMRRIDMVFVESQPMTLGIAGLLMKWFRRVPYVYNVPDLQTDVAKQLGFLGAKTLLRSAEMLENCCMRNAWTVATVTERFIDYFVSRGVPRDKLSFLPNGVDTDLLKPLPYDRAYAEQLGMAEKKVFAYVGTHAHYHGLEVLIDAAEHLRDRDDIVLLLAGDGPVRETLRQTVQQRNLTNVVFGPAPFPFREMPRLMSVSWAALAVVKDIPAAAKMRLAKTFPPLACGVPVVYSGAGESADMVREAGCGLCVPAESPRELAGAVRRLADDRKLRDEMGRRGIELIENGLSWNSIIAHWLSEIDALRSVPQRAAAQRPAMQNVEA